MRCKSLVLALTAAGGVASAQPGPPPQPPPPVDTATTTTTTTTNTTETPVVAPTPVVMSAPPPVTQPAPEAAGSRPDGTAFGLGIGYQLPTSLETPNVASLRVRLAGGLTFEPAFTISNASETAEMTGVEATNKHTTFSLAARGRMPLISRGKADFEGLAELGFTNDKDNPDGDFNTTTTNAFDIGWGLAVGYWFTQHWQFTFNVTNPLVTFSSRKIQNAGETTKDSTTELGLTFNPAVFMMLHLYN